MSVISTVLIISPEKWDAHTVSKHHYAMALAGQGATVFFLNPPDNSINKLSIIKSEKYPAVHIVSAPKIATGLRFYPAIVRCWLEKRWLARLEEMANTKVDVIWLFENSRFFDMGFAGKRLKIYHQVDLNQDFNPAQAASTADICFCTTDFIKERLVLFNPRIYKIHHGLAVVKNRVTLTDAQLEKFKKNETHAVYIGNLDMLYLDAELLASVARKFADVQFHFVGGYREDGPLRSLVGDQPNVIWWGKVDSSQIPAILDQANAMLVTYQAAHYEDQASPHKFMEYFNSGKTIVSTYTEEYKDKRDLLEMVDDSHDFLLAFDRVINNLPFYNSADKQKKRIAFAQEHTYQKQLDKITAHLQQNDLHL